MESVQPRTDTATRYAPLTATTGIQPAGNAGVARSETAGKAGNAFGNSGETTATFSRRAQELSARQTQDVRQARNTQDQDRMTAQRTSETMQARQTAEGDAAADAARRTTAQSTVTEMAGALGAQARRAYQGVDGMSTG